MYHTGNITQHLVVSYDRKQPEKNIYVTYIMHMENNLNRIYICVCMYIYMCMCLYIYIYITKSLCSTVKLTQHYKSINYNF